MRRKDIGVTSRPFSENDDYWLIRNLLIETYRNTPTGFNWEVQRWDGMRYYNADPGLNPDWNNLIRIWETKNGEVVGAIHPEGTGKCLSG